MSSLRDELRPLVPVFNAARRALDQSRWRLGMDVDDLIADIVLAVAKELSGPSTAVLDRLRAAEAERDSILAIVSAWCIEANNIGGVDATDLAWRLEEAGHALPEGEGE